MLASFSTWHVRKSHTHIRQVTVSRIVPRKRPMGINPIGNDVCFSHMCKYFYAMRYNLYTPLRELSPAVDKRSSTRTFRLRASRLTAFLLLLQRVSSHDTQRGVTQVNPDTISRYVCSAVPLSAGLWWYQQVSIIRHCLCGGLACCGDGSGLEPSPFSRWRRQQATRRDTFSLSQERTAWELSEA